jgi:uncharacterized protein (TIGR03067 family)
MNSRLLFALAVPLVVVMAALGDDETVKAAKQLEGEWLVERAERGGAPAKELVGATYRFADGKIVARPADKDLPPRSAPYRILPPAAAGKPMRIAFTPQEGKNKGAELEGVFRFKDGKLEICHCAVRKADKAFEPAAFDTKPGSGWVLLKLKKKEQK